VIDVEASVRQGYERKIGKHIRPLPVANVMFPRIAMTGTSSGLRQAHHQR
jgi:hypothetical protein